MNDLLNTDLICLQIKRSVAIYVISVFVIFIRFQRKKEVSNALINLDKIYSLHQIIKYKID